jgi:hypothetical protein
MLACCTPFLFFACCFVWLFRLYEAMCRAPIQSAPHSTPLRGLGRRSVGWLIGILVSLPLLHSTLGDRIVCSMSNTICCCSSCRCPNPAACQHNATLLANVHPDSKTGPPLPWLDYGAQLCNYQEGYQGILCGSSCIKGFGVTSPFKCNRCLGITVTPSVDNGYTAGVSPGPSKISAVYFVYWFVLTCWMLFTVRSFVHSSDQQQQKQARRTAATAAVAAAPAGPPAEYRSGSPSFKDASGSPMKEYENSPQGGASRTQKEIPIGGAVRESSRSLDITKGVLWPREARGPCLCACTCVCACACVPQD